MLALEGVDGVASLDELARNWALQVSSASELTMHAAIDLYAGRSITEAKRAAESVSASLHIVSAGHGLLQSDAVIPSYNVTVSPGLDNALYRCLLRFDQSPADWWRALIGAFGEQRSLAGLLASSSKSVVLLAVPSTYLMLLAGELAEITVDLAKRLRIVTSPHGASVLPAHLQSAVLPYDERLEGLAPYAGTRSDFPQRALRHFVTVLKGHELPLESARNQVRQAMEGLQKPIVPERKRKTDDEILTLLRENWGRLNGSATALLRYLRDDALVACEQSRFRTLRQQVLSELNQDNLIHG